jgi:hypothetical protein
VKADRLNKWHRGAQESAEDAIGVCGCTLVCPRSMEPGRTRYVDPSIAHHCNMFAPSPIFRRKCASSNEDAGLANLKDGIVRVADKKSVLFQRSSVRYHTTSDIQWSTLLLKITCHLIRRTDPRSTCWLDIFPMFGPATPRAGSIHPCYRRVVANKRGLLSQVRA